LADKVDQNQIWGIVTPRFCRLPGLVRNVGTGPPGQASPRRKGWNPSYKILKSHQIKGEPQGVRRAVPRTVRRRQAKVGGTLPGANGVNRSTHSAGCCGKGGTLDGGHRKRTGKKPRRGDPGPRFRSPIIASPSNQTKSKSDCIVSEPRIAIIVRSGVFPAFMPDIKPGGGSAVRRVCIEQGEGQCRRGCRMVAPRSLAGTHD